MVVFVESDIELFHLDGLVLDRCIVAIRRLPISRLFEHAAKCAMSLPHSVLDTAALPLARRLPTWREAAGSLWDVTPTDDDPFFARVNAFKAGELIVGTVTSSAQSTNRSPAKIAADSLDCYVLQFYLQGRLSAQDRRHEHLLQGGDLLVVDSMQPISTVATSFQTLNLIVSRRLLAPFLTDPDVHGARRFETGNPLNALLRSHVRALHDNASSMSTAEAVAAQDATLALVAAVLNGHVPEDRATAVRGVGRAALRRFIEARLGDLDLDAGKAASQFGISRATLYRLCEPSGGFATLLREQRLRRCRDDLANRLLAHQSIASIVERWGFGNPAAFSVAFSRCFGIAPSEFRKLAFGRSRQGGSKSAVADWSRWLAELR